MSGKSHFKVSCGMRRKIIKFILTICFTTRIPCAFVAGGMVKYDTVPAES